MRTNILVAALLMSAASAGFAQTASSTVQRNVNQEARIEQGLQNGSLTTREAAELQREQSNIDRMQARDLRDGKLTDAERAKLQAAQNKASRDITSAEHNGVRGDPLSASSQRMQADVQRNLNQQARTEAGIKNGSLTNREVAHVEQGQARVDRKEYAAGRDGHVSAHEQGRVQRAENRQSRRIFREKHDPQERKSS
jgi:hypothetical protein